MRRLSVTVMCVAASLALGAQTPQPFPRAPEPRPNQAPGATAAPPAQAPAATGAPGQAELGFPVYPSSQFLGAYDAGRGQKYYLFGSTAAFADLVGYYRTQLNEKGTLVFKEPPTHMFEVGRFREETMAFPPGVTVKDWTWGGSQGYLNPKPGAQPARFPTVLMIVPAPAAAAPAAR
jgi:hypothetical protein